MTPKLTPTEADREMAACLVEEQFALATVPEQIRAGQWDDHPAVQAFAQHAATARAEERERAAKIAESVTSWFTRAEIAAAIRKGSPA